MRRSWLAPLLLLAVIVAVYLPVMTLDFVYSDDPVLHAQGQVEHRAIRTQANDGRFLYGFWLAGPVAQVHTVAGFKYVRMLTVVGIALSAVVLFRLVRRWLIRDELWAAALAALFALNPGCLALSGWATLGAHCWAAWLGLCSVSILLGRGGRADSGEPIPGGAPLVENFARPATSALLGSAALLFLAEALYQPTAMAFWIGIGLWIAGQFDARKAAWRKLALFLALFGVTTLVYFVCAKLLTESGSRVALKISPLRRLAWFVVYPFRGSIAFPALNPSLALSIASAVVLGSGVWLYCRRRQRPVWVWLGLGAMLPLLTLPSLVAAMHYDVFRIRLPLYGMVVVFWSLTLAAWVTTAERLRQARAALLIATVAIALLGQFHLLHHFILPQVVEQSFIQQRLSEYLRESPDLTRPIVVYPPPKSDDYAGLFVDDEWGIPSSSQVWATVPLVRLLLASAQQRPLQELGAVPIARFDEPHPDDAFVIDLRMLKLAR
jgi:hypothetical protein